MSERSRKIALVAVFLVACGTAALAYGWRETYEGCMKCTGTLANGYCANVGTYETGSVLCTAYGTSQWSECYTHGEPCFNVNVIGGGGGGEGGSSGSSCTVRPGQVCPAWCASCGTRY
jgi:hypothetical protein